MCSQMSQVIVLLPRVSSHCTVKTVSSYCFADNIPVFFLGFFFFWFTSFSSRSLAYKCLKSFFFFFFFFGKMGGGGGVFTSVSSNYFAHKVSDYFFPQVSQIIILLTNVSSHCFVHKCLKSFFRSQVSQVSLYIT